MNTFFIDEVRRLKAGKFITDAQYHGVILQTPQLKTHRNWLVRIGFFILGSMLYSSISGVLSLFVWPGVAADHYRILLFAYAAIGLAGSEFLARKGFFAHGLDDAFVLGFLGTVVLAFGMVTASATVASLVLAVFGIFCCLRYVNIWAGLFGLIGIAAFSGCLVFDLEIISKWALPFIGLVLGVTLYLAYLLLNRLPQARFYSNALLLMQVFAIVLGYASVNYFVVRELSVALLDVEVKPGNDIAFAPVFYVLTFLIPIGLVYFGLKRHQRALLIVGILASGGSVLTIRHYYGILPAEVALLVGGVALFALSVFAIRRLKGKQTGLTFEPDRNSETKWLEYVQIAATNLHAGHQNGDRNENQMTFGGGGFSGGGAGETY